MKNYLSYAVFIFILLGCGTQKHVYNSKIYEEMYVCQRGLGFTGEPQNLYRKQLDYLNKFEYSLKNDTVYILEMYGVQGNISITIWNKNKKLSYTYKQGFFESMNKALFTKYMMKLVSEWNISEIRKEEEINTEIMPCELIFATKIIFNKGEYHIDCISFKEFFNFERDKNDFQWE
jgi:hypothetical protein